MNRTHAQKSIRDSCVSVPADALDDLLEAIWHWAFEDYLTTPSADRRDHIFNTIVRLDSALHGISVEESWARIQRFREDCQHKSPWE